MSRLHLLGGTYYIKQIFNGTPRGSHYCFGGVVDILWHIQRTLIRGLVWIPQSFLGSIPSVLPFVRERWSETVNPGDAQDVW